MRTTAPGSSVAGTLKSSQSQTLVRACQTPPSGVRAPGICETFTKGGARVLGPSKRALINMHKIRAVVDCAELVETIDLVWGKDEAQQGKIAELLPSLLYGTSPSPGDVVDVGLGLFLRGTWSSLDIRAVLGSMVSSDLKDFINTKSGVRAVVTHISTRLRGEAANWKTLLTKVGSGRFVLTSLAVQAFAEIVPFTVKWGVWFAVTLHLTGMSQPAALLHLCGVWGTSPEALAVVLNSLRAAYRHHEIELSPAESAEVVRVAQCWTNVDSSILGTRLAKLVRHLCTDMTEVEARSSVLTCHVEGRERWPLTTLLAICRGLTVPPFTPEYHGSPKAQMEFMLSMCLALLVGLMLAAPDQETSGSGRMKSPDLLRLRLSVNMFQGIDQVELCKRLMTSTSWDQALTAEQCAQVSFNDFTPVYIVAQPCLSGTRDRSS
jgi:hypothetical protein